MTELSLLDEIAQLYRPDCPIETIARSQFKRRLLGDPTWPLACAMRYLAARPTALDLEALAKRGDIPTEMLVEAARVGIRRAVPGRARGSYLQLKFLPVEFLGELVAEQDLELRAALRSGRCPERVIAGALTAEHALTRWMALRRIERDNLPIDSAYIRAAMTLPMRDSSFGPPMGYRFRVETTAKNILASR